MDELLKAIKSKIAEMKKIEKTGFTDPAKAAEYFQDKEVILEEITKTLETLTVNQSTQVTALEGTVKELRKELKTQAAYPKELTLNELYYKLGKGIAATYRGNNTALAELGFKPNFKDTEDWTNPNDVNWEMGKGWIKQRAGMGSPMGDMETSDRFLILPSYETELVSIAEKKSVMMPLVDSSIMTSATKKIPVEEDTNLALEWLTNYGDEIPEVEQPRIEWLELKALVCAGYIRYYDDFEDDSFLDLGKMFVKKFIGSYSREFDKQCLVANNAPFTGALATNRAKVAYIKGNSIDKLTYEDFEDATLLVPAEERNECRWFLHETVCRFSMKLKDANGNPIVRKPMEKIPGVIDLYPYHESHVMPQFNEIGADTPFAVFMNPQRISHGNRKGIELMKFDKTEESLKRGTKALRFRKRDGFCLAIPRDHMVILKTKPAGGGGSTTP